MHPDIEACEAKVQVVRGVRRLDKQLAVDSRWPRPADRMICGGRTDRNSITQGRRDPKGEGLGL